MSFLLRNAMYISSFKCFNEEILYTESVVSLDELRISINLIMKVLDKNNLLNEKICKVRDWFEHDGYLTTKEVISKDFILELTKDNETFYKSRSGETYAKLGLFDECYRWYLRIYIIDEYDLKEDEEKGGTFDICINKEISKLLKSQIEYVVLIKLKRDEPKKFFEQRYAR
ncbi:hypothetical protein [Brassicibacter mesophilus]|uniref:hypothetical protein n=1 Tax=Brassicibacter mesophilus TaxID=745119 RepID=UPI003D248BC7